MRFKNSYFSIDLHGFLLRKVVMVHGAIAGQSHVGPDLLNCCVRALQNNPLDWGAE